jgi:hypothetical protein
MGRVSYTNSIFVTTEATHSSIHQPEFTLWNGLSDDDMAFAARKVDRDGKVIAYNSLTEQIHKLKPAVSRDDKFARLVWERVLKKPIAKGAAVA